MDIKQLVAELRAERDQITQAIAAIEALERGGKRENTQKTTAGSRRAASARPRRTMSAAARKRISEAAKKRWAERRKAAKTA
jgi:hypothetical protein